MSSGITKRKYGASRKGIAAARAAAKAVQIFRARNPAIMGSPYSYPFRGGGGGGKELKTIDTAGVNSLVTVGGAVVLLNGVAQGSDYTDRIGRKTCMKSFFFKFDIRLASVSTPTGEMARALIVYDSQANGAAPTVANILSTATALSPMNLNNRDRFKVLKDWLIPLEFSVFTAGALTQGSPMRHIRKTYKKLNLDVIFGGTGATVASIQTGSIYLLTIGTVGSVATFDYDSRIRFVDA